MAAPPRIADLEEANRCLRDLIALSTLPAVWLGAEPHRVAESLSAALYTTLDAQLVYVRVQRPGNANVLTVVQTERYRTDATLAHSVSDGIERFARTHEPDDLLSIDHPAGQGRLRVAARLLGHDGELGVIAVGFDSPQAPHPFQLTLLNVAAVQAASAMTHAWLVFALRQADERKDAFIATLAHELRNPLAPMRTGLDILKYASVDTDTLGQCRNIMERQFDHLTRLVDDLLEVSRITQGKLKLQFERVNLESVVRTAIEDTRELMHDARHELLVSLPDEPVWVRADPMRLSQVFTNLLGNAAKYTPPGGRVEVRAEPLAAGVALVVTDNGIGIPQDKLTMIFEMFGQLDRSHSKASMGLGIGLSLVKSLVEMHGGRVTARSDGEGSGSAFEVWLPRAAAPEPPAPQVPRPASRAGATPARHRILVVDDNEDAANLLLKLLGLLGQEVREAFDGMTAIAIAAEFRPDLVLLDIGLPQLDGYEVARRLRALPGGDRMILAALTGWGQEADRKRAVEATFDHHLTKPASLPMLENLLESLPRRTVGSDGRGLAN